MCYVQHVTLSLIGRSAPHYYVRVVSMHLTLDIANVNKRLACLNLQE